MDDNYIDSLLSSEVYLSILTTLILNLGPNLFDIFSVQNGTSGFLQ